MWRRKLNCPLNRFLIPTHFLSLCFINHTHTHTRLIDFQMSTKSDIMDNCYPIVHFVKFDISSVFTQLSISSSRTLWTIITQLSFSPSWTYLLLLPNCPFCQVGHYGQLLPNRPFRQVGHYGELLPNCPFHHSSPPYVRPPNCHLTTPSVLFPAKHKRHPIVYYCMREIRKNYEKGTFL